MVQYTKLIAQAKTGIWITRSIQPWEKYEIRSENLYGDDVALKDFL